MWRSVPQTDAASNWIFTCPGPAIGSSTSIISTPGSGRTLAMALTGEDCTGRWWGRCAGREVVRLRGCGALLVSRFRGFEDSWDRGCGLAGMRGGSLCAEYSVPIQFGQGDSQIDAW